MQEAEDQNKAKELIDLWRLSGCWLQIGVVLIERVNERDEDYVCLSSFRLVPNHGFLGLGL